MPGNRDGIYEFDKSQQDKPAGGKSMIEFIEITTVDEKRMKKCKIASKKE